MKERLHTHGSTAGTPDSQDIDMNDELQLPPGASAAEAAAAAWIVRMSSGGVNEEERKRLQVWLMADPEHRRHFRAMQAVWMNAPARAGALAGQAHKPRRRIAAMPLAAAATILFAVIGLLYFIYRPQYVLYTTGVGEQRIVRADDGSVVNLNTDSEFALRLTEHARSAELRRGEAYFAVQPDTGRPFEIDLDGSLIRVVGTHFNVRRERDYFSVAVVDGVVQVQIDSGNPGLQPTTLTAGQQLTYRDGAAAPLIQPLAGQRAPEWVNGRLSFENVALPEALAEAKRYLAQSIAIADVRLEAVKVSGVFRIDRLDEFVKILEEEGLVRAERAEDGRGLRLYAP